MNPVQIVKYLLENNEHMVVSTADLLAKPWVSPVFYVYDDNYNFYWVSSKDTLHSRNIKDNSRVAIVIFGYLPDGIMEGVYVDAEASELENELDIKNAIKVLHNRIQPKKYIVNSLSDVTDEAAWRIYKAVPKSIFRRLSVIDKKSKQVVNTREEVDLKSL